MNFAFTRQIDKLGRIVIPKDIREALNLTSNDKIKLVVEDEKVFFEKIQNVTEMK